MRDRIRFLLNRVGERLWVKPLAMCVLSVVAAFGAKLADRTGLGAQVPAISADLLETLLSIMSSSMLVIATFAVASMVSAYASASSTATPRSFSLIIADDVSQNALSTFIGAFIFSIVALIVLKSGYFEPGARFALFVLTLTAFGAVILTFVTWVDRIARLGRLGATIDKVEAATTAAMIQRKRAPTFGCALAEPGPAEGIPVYAATIGYVQHLDVSRLQAFAEDTDTLVTVAALPGTFATPDRVLACISGRGAVSGDLDLAGARRGFLIGDARTFDDDPRFGLVVLAEIASRALSPAVNDAGTAIDVTGTFVRLLARWCQPLEDGEAPAVTLDRVAVPSISVEDLFDDAFTSIARDGAGIVEVAARLQKALRSLAALGDTAMRAAAERHACLALARSEAVMQVADDLSVVRELAGLAAPGHLRSPGNAPARERGAT